MDALFGMIVLCQNSFSQVVDRLRSAGVTLERGLSSGELDQVEERFGFSFSLMHRQFLTAVLPLGLGWVDWRHGDREEIEGRFACPIESALFDVERNSFWPVSWGDRAGCPGARIGSRPDQA